MLPLCSARGGGVELATGSADLRIHPPFRLLGFLAANPTWFSGDAEKFHKSLPFLCHFDSQALLPGFVPNHLTNKIPRMMKSIHIAICLLVACQSLFAQIIDRNDFETPIGSVFHYRGTFNGAYGESVVSYLDGSGVVPNSLRTDNNFTSANPDGNSSMTTYWVDTAIIRRDVSNQYGSFTMWFSPAWRLGPRFIEIGRTYESSTGFSYQVSGITVDGTISGSGSIVGTEWVTVPVGTFHAMKMVLNTTSTENFAGGWTQTVETDTVWFVRGVGTVKYQATAFYEDSTGASRRIESDYQLVYTNRALPRLTVTQSDSWYEGRAYIDFPWVYLFDSRRWVFIYGNPWEMEMTGYTYAQFGDGYLDGFAIMDFPWLWSYTDSRFHFVYGPLWLYDMDAASLWKLD